MNSSRGEATVLHCSRKGAPSSSNRCHLRFWSLHTTVHRHFTIFAREDATHGSHLKLARDCDTSTPRLRWKRRATKRPTSRADEGRTRAPIFQNMGAAKGCQNRPPILRERVLAEKQQTSQPAQIYPHSPSLSSRYNKWWCTMRKNREGKQGAKKNPPPPRIIPEREKTPSFSCTGPEFFRFVCLPGSARERAGP